MCMNDYSMGCKEEEQWVIPSIIHNLLQLQAYHEYQKSTYTDTYFQHRQNQILEISNPNATFSNHVNLYIIHVPYISQRNRR